jgi:XrtJ-associated TM-motif-TM protein
VKTIRFFAVLVILFLPVGSAFADTGGCIDSPENPTAVLFVVGLTGYALSRWSLHRRAVGKRNDDDAR